MTKFTISDSWEFTQLPSSNIPDTAELWNPCSVPTSVQASLLKLGKIPDPYKDLAEWDIQCKLDPPDSSRENASSADGVTGIAEADWQFRTSFTVSSKQLSDPEADLVFEGLDTYCDISLVRAFPLTLELKIRSLGLSRMGNI